MDKIDECISQAPIFSKLSEKDRDGLIALAQQRKYEKGETICWQGESWPMAAYLAFGVAEWAMLSPEGKRQVVFKLNACDVVWAHSILDDQPMPVSLEVKESTLVYLWPREIIQLLISQNVEVVWDVSRVLLISMRHVREVVYGFAFHPVAGRLAQLLLTHYQPVEGQPAPRNMTLDEMAETVGTTRELVSRTLHRFADDDMIQINRLEFVFTDKKRLEKWRGMIKRETPDTREFRFYAG